MTPRRIFLWLPLALIALMLISALLVPSYQAQSRGNPTRFSSFVEPSIGDAQLLNPILQADSASSRIVSLVFDGLLDYDPDLQLVPKLATSFAVSEHLYINVPGSDVDIHGRLTKALQENAHRLGKARVELVELMPSNTEPWLVALGTQNDETLSATITVSFAKRIKLTLSEVVPDAQSILIEWLGEDWHQSQPEISVSPGDYTDDQQALIDAATKEHAALVEHNPVIQFNLRTGVRFHDGELFDADDVVFTYESIINAVNASPRTSDFDSIKSVTANNSHQVIVIYKRLFSPAILAWTLPILPAHLLDKPQVELEMDRQGVEGDARESFGMRQMPFNRNPVGTGAYQFSQWLSDDRIDLVANKDYWGGVPHFERYTYRILPDPLSQELELTSGSVDMLKPQPHQVHRFSNDDRFNKVTNTAFGYSYIGYNLRRPIFADKRVRQALSMAINVDDMIKYVLHGQGERTTGPYPSTTPWTNGDVGPVPYDPIGAATLLKQAGYTKNADGWLEKDGKALTFNLITNQGNNVRKAILAIAQDAWRKLGIRVNTQVFEWAVFLKDFVNAGEFDALVLGWSLSPDPDQYQLWHSSQTGPSQLNFTGFKNSRADELIEKIRLEYNHDRQRALTGELHSLIAEEQPYTFLFNGRDTRVLNKTLALVSGQDQVEPIRRVNSGNVFQEFIDWGKREHSLSF